MGKTRGVHETTPELRNRMVGMYEAGLGLREIAAAINCSQRTVKRWLNRFDKEGTVETRERCGRKRATTSEQDDAIVRLATQTPITAAKAVLPALGLNCSVDTIRERLHKAGIHNWSPSRKHIQRIPLGEADGAAIQQAVWRPTGTQLGKKKTSKNQVKSKTTNANASKIKKKKTVKKVKEQEPPTCEPNPPLEKEQTDCQVPFNPPQTIIHCHDLPPLDHPNNMNNQGQFNSVSNHTEMYSHVPEMSISRNWPLDLVQSNQTQYLQPPENISPPSTSSHLQELYPHNSHLHHHQSLQQHMTTPPMNVDEPVKPPDSSETTNSESSMENQILESQKTEAVESDGAREKSDDGDSNNDSRKKKGGKAKGTLETSVELRNRMIGMSQAGLSTLSIALAINRSERTVKRWLERWKKEGNVQTKERKGRRRITTKEQDEAIIALATQNPLTAAKHVAPALGLKCSVDTIRERLHKAGIHSWKLGKKQGEGNAVHTVHLWQPSGNRPNRPRILRKNNQKRPGKKQGSSTQRMNRKKSINKVEEKTSNSIAPDNSRVENIPVPQIPTIQQSPMQFHDNGDINSFNDSNSNVLQPVGILTPLNPSAAGQQVQVVAPIMRPDCRMATGQVSSGFSSCMVANSGHIEQPDPLNYEPYIWNF